MPAEKSPDAFRTISEVAEWLEVPAHVLRFWESRFTQVKPVKRAGGRRYYRRADIALLDGIRKLLHDDGMTIRGVQKMLREDGIGAVTAHARPISAEAAGAPMAEDVPLDELQAKVLPFLRPGAAPTADAEEAEMAEDKAADPFVEAAGPAETAETYTEVPASPEPEPEPEPEAEPETAAEPAAPPPAAVLDLPEVSPDPEDDDPAFAAPPRSYAGLASADPQRLRALHDRLAAIRRRLGDPRQPPG